MTYELSFSYEFLGWRTWVVCHGLKKGTCASAYKYLPQATIKLSSAGDNTRSIISTTVLDPQQVYIHIHTQLFNGPLSGTTLMSQHQKKHSPTHSRPDHQPSFINFLHVLYVLEYTILHAQAFPTSSVINFLIWRNM